MVTHGYVAFKYKGIYYTFYNHSDSYFEHLGNLVVNEINQMVNENSIRYCKNLLLRIPLKGNEEGDWNIHDFYSLLNHPASYQYFTSNDEPGSNYTYIIDFDDNKFIANRYGENIYTFNLYDIPDDWYEITQNNSNYEDSFDKKLSNEDSSDEEVEKNIDEYNNAILNKIEKLKLKLKSK